MEIIIGITTGILSSIIAAWLLTTIYFKPLIEKTKAEIDRLINPVQEFSNIDQFLNLLKQSLDSYKNDFSRLVLHRGMPLEISDALLKYIGVNGQSKSLTDYQNNMNSIIKEGDGSYDKSVFGKTGIPEIDNGTRNIITSHYFSNTAAPDTTEIGLHNNLNEIGVILIGKGESKSKIGNIVWDYGFLLVFSSDYKSIRGFKHVVPQHINNLVMIFEQKMTDSKTANSYWDLSKLSQTQLIATQSTIYDFHNT